MEIRETRDVPPFLGTFLLHQAAFNSGARVAFGAGFCSATRKS